MKEKEKSLKELFAMAKRKPSGCCHQPADKPASRGNENKRKPE